MAKKKQNLEDLSQSHGKEEKFVPTTLDQIWGDEGLSKYGTMEEEVYEEKIQEMNKTDLWSHASKIGLVPIDNTNLLRKTLLSEFRKHVNMYRKVLAPEEKPSKLSKEALKILSEGR